MYTLLNFAFIAKLNQKTAYSFSIALNYRLGGGGWLIRKSEPAPIL